MGPSNQPLILENGHCSVLDQRLLPNEVVYSPINSLQDGFDAIALMKVRGAPLIGFTAIFTMSVWCKDCSDQNLNEAISYLNSPRPTAVNLIYELKIVKEMIQKELDSGKKLSEIANIIYQHGLKRLDESEKRHQTIANFGLEEMKNIFGKRKLNLLTHCNTGRLACGSLGTALGVISNLAQNKKVKQVFVDETRPYLQGSRLTAFELLSENIDHKIVVEGSASFLMKNKLVDAIFVGADRIAANGDTANKIGTANLSIIAKYYNIPFYIVAPLSTFDLDAKTGLDIEIEFRNAEEIKNYKNYVIAPKKSATLNPSFDITEAKNITGIICEKGIIRPRNSRAIEEVFYA